jgi:hypothetical protein
MATRKRTTKRTAASGAADETPGFAQEHDHGATEPCSHRGGHDHGAVDESCPECFVASREHLHHDFDHFPSEVELEARGVVTRVASEPEILRRLSSNRFAETGTLETDAFNSVAKNVNDLRLKPWNAGSSLVALRGPWISGLIRYFNSFHRVRRDHRALDDAQRKTFNNALAALDGNPAWQTLMNYHVGGIYRMHSMHGPIGTQRFLSWHRKYLFEAEQMLRAVDPTVTIPYWDYATDGSRPDWVHKPTGVSRPTPGAPGFLPTGGTITTILGRGDYASFTIDIENNAHNQVHNWSKGTLQSPSTASFDPVFWLLHGNVDRLWSIWQETNYASVVDAPSITGADRVLDPWSVSITDVDDTAWDMGYRYA